MNIRNVEINELDVILAKWRVRHTLGPRLFALEIVKYDQSANQSSDTCGIIQSEVKVYLVHLVSCVNVDTGWIWRCEV